MLSQINGTGLLPCGMRRPFDPDPRCRKSCFVYQRWTSSSFSNQHLGECWARRGRIPMRKLFIGVSALVMLASAAYIQQSAGPVMAAETEPGRFLVFFDLNEASLTPEAGRVVARAAQDYRQGGTAADHRHRPYRHFRLRGLQSRAFEAPGRERGPGARERRRPGDQHHHGRPRRRGPAGADRGRGARAAQPSGRDRGTAGAAAGGRRTGRAGSAATRRGADRGGPKDG